MNNIAWKRPDGGVTITWLTSESSGPEQEAEKLLRRGDIPSGWVLAGYNVEVPADRTYRNAWAFGEGRITHDLVKAKNIQRDKIRAVRSALLLKLDTLYLQADETNDHEKKRKIIDLKNQLRSAPQDPSIDAAKTIEELKLAWPSILDEQILL